MYRITTIFLVLTLVASAFSLDGVYNFVAAPGDLDITFSGDGKVTDTFPGGFARGYAVAVQPDGKIVTAGKRTIGSQEDFGIMRFNEDGSPDTSFGTAGKVVTSIGAGSSQARAVAIQSDGKIVAAGESATGFAVVRYNIDGSLDTSFGKDGCVETAGGIGTSMALTMEGKIVVAGYEEEGTDDDFVVVRYNQDGSLDNTFDSDGIATTPVGSGNDNAFAVAVYSDGKIVAAGWGHNVQSTDFAVVRYNVDGTLDTSFDNDGRVLTRIGSAPTSIGFAVAIRPNGKIIIAGTTILVSNYDFALVQYNMDGSRDTSYGSNGEVVTRVGVNQDIITGIGLQADGRIVAAGHSFRSVGDNFALARYETNGSLDLSYGINGIRLIDFGGEGTDRARGMAIDGQGRTVVGGESNAQFALARLLNDGTSPTSTGSVSGRIVTANGSGITKVRITLTDSSGQPRNAITGSFGYYKFDDVPVNASYTISVSAKRYSFANPSRVINVQNDVTDVDFVSVE